jgi:hypothetical protein
MNFCCFAVNCSIGNCILDPLVFRLAIIIRNFQPTAGLEILAYA